MESKITPQKLSSEDFLNDFMKTQMYEILDNESFDNVCFTYRITNKLAGNSYRISMNQKLPEELKKFLFLHEAGHIYCRHNSLKTTLDYQFTAPKIKAVYNKLEPLFDGQDIDEMYDLFEDYILNMIRDWEVNTKFFTEEEIRYWDTLYPEECCAGEPVVHMLPQDVGYEPGLSANEYLLCILKNPEQWFKNILQQNGGKSPKKHKNGTEGGCNTNQQTPPNSDNSDYNADSDKNHNKEDREKKSKQNNQQNGNQNSQNGNNQQQSQSDQNDDKGEGSAEQNQQAANENNSQEWKDEKNNDSKESQDEGDNENKSNGSSSDEQIEDKNKNPDDTEGNASEDETSEESNLGKDGKSGEEKDSTSETDKSEELTKEELQELVKQLVKKMITDYQRQQESANQQRASQAKEVNGYSRDGGGDGQGVALNDGVTNWSDYDGLEKQVRELLIDRTSTVTKRDLLYNYNRGRFSSDVCVPRYRAETTYDEVPMTVLLDVSGSISQSDILGFCNIFKNVAKSMSKKCTIVLWDTELRAVFDTNDEIQPISGGGTDIGKGIKWIADNMNPNDVGSLFIVSDCCDNLNEWLDIYKKTKYLVCWSDMNTIQSYIESSLYNKFMGEFEKVLCKNYEE